MINHFLSLANFSSSQILSLIKRAHYFSLHPQKSLLQNQIFANIFYEPSTRTRCSFEVAAKRLGAEIINFTPEFSSVKKGETVFDTLKSLESLGVNGLIIRHADDYLVESLCPRFQVPLINAGAGKNEHPSQGLLDLMTIYQEFKDLEGLNIVVCGDIKHSRVVGSLKIACAQFKMNLFLCGPSFFLPQLSAEDQYVQIADFDDAISKADVVMMLRTQLERHLEQELDEQNYLHEFGLNEERVNKMKPHSIILHPGPFHRGVEIADALIEHDKSRIFKQMSNGVFVRMAILEWVIKGLHE